MLVIICNSAPGLQLGLQGADMDQPSTTTFQQGGDMPKRQAREYQDLKPGTGNQDGMPWIQLQQKAHFLLDNVILSMHSTHKHEP